MTEQELSAYIQAIRPADEAAMKAARRRQAQLAKPPGSLGQLEEISIRLAGVTGQVCPAMGKCRVAVFAADNGVVAEGVSCTPPAVTLQQAVNMTFRKTGMSAMAAAFGDDVSVVDVGIDGDVPPVGVLDRKVRRGTGDIAREDAMTRQQVLDAMAAGMEQAARARADGVTALGIGEMGIGNTTTSAAVLAALTGADIEAVTGRGGGLTDKGFLRKKEVLRQALALHRPDGSDVIGVLAGGGGRVHLHRGGAVRRAAVPRSAGCAVSVPRLLRGRLPHRGGGAGAPALPASGDAAGRGQRVSPAVPRAGGRLRRHAGHGHVRRGFH